MKNCRTVAASLVRKYAFLIESVSEHIAENQHRLCFYAKQDSIPAAKTQTESHQILILLQHQRGQS